MSSVGGPAHKPCPPALRPPRLTRAHALFRGGVGERPRGPRPDIGGGWRRKGPSCPAPGNFPHKPRLHFSSPGTDGVGGGRDRRAPRRRTSPQAPPPAPLPSVSRPGPDEGGERKVVMPRAGAPHKLRLPCTAAPPLLALRRGRPWSVPPFSLLGDPCRREERGGARGRRFWAGKRPSRLRRSAARQGVWSLLAEGSLLRGGKRRP